MELRLLLVEPDTGVSLGALIRRDPVLRFDRIAWDEFGPALLQGLRADLIVAVAASDACRSIGLLKLAGGSGSATPTLAVIPADGDEALLRTTTELADDFILSPVREDELHWRIQRALGRREQHADEVRSRLMREAGLSQFVGDAPSFVRAVEQIPIFAATDAPVLITGETGTGKELFARAIHHLGKRNRYPFIAVECGAIPDHLFENELFGHARGAFTDAYRDQQGLVALAEGGTLFLDEVDSLPAPSQAKLLRFLQERTFRPLGSERFRRADVNVIAASNKNLEDCVKKNLFRSDLYFRLNVLRLALSPLRERRGDITLLAEHFLEQLASAHAKGRKVLSPTALRKLVSYDWPGNARELSNVVQRAFVLAQGRQILPCHATLPCDTGIEESSGLDFRTRKAVAVEQFERAYVGEMLRKHCGNVTQAAREARKERRAFGRLIKKYGIERGQG